MDRTAYGNAQTVAEDPSKLAKWRAMDTRIHTVPAKRLDHHFSSDEPTCCQEESETDLKSGLKSLADRLRSV